MAPTTAKRPKTSQNGTSSTANWLHNMSRTLPPMLQVMKDIGGIEIPETLSALSGSEKTEAAAKPKPKPKPAPKAE